MRVREWRGGAGGESEYIATVRALTVRAMRARATIDLRGRRSKLAKRSAQSERAAQQATRRSLIASKASSASITCPSLRTRKGRRVLFFSRTSIASNTYSNLSTCSSAGLRKGASLSRRLGHGFPTPPCNAWRRTKSSSAGVGTAPDAASTKRTIRLNASATMLGSSFTCMTRVGRARSSSAAKDIK